MIIKSVHLVRDDEDGRDLLELIQQRAEQWAAANLVTVVLNSDDYWVYERMKNYATRLKVLPVKDLTRDAALAALKAYRLRYYGETSSDDLLNEVYSRVGGRLSFLSRVAKEQDMLKVCRDIEEREKTWFLNKVCTIFTNFLHLFTRFSAGSWARRWTTTLWINKNTHQLLWCWPKLL